MAAISLLTIVIISAALPAAFEAAINFRKVKTSRDKGQGKRKMYGWQRAP